MEEKRPTKQQLIYITIGLGFIVITLILLLASGSTCEGFGTGGLLTPCKGYNLINVIETHKAEFQGTQILPPPSGPWEWIALIWRGTGPTDYYIEIIPKNYASLTPNQERANDYIMIKTSGPEKRLVDTNGILWQNMRARNNLNKVDTFVFVERERMLNVNDYKHLQKPVGKCPPTYKKCSPDPWMCNTNKLKILRKQRERQGCVWTELQKSTRPAASMPWCFGDYTWLNKSYYMPRYRNIYKSR